MQDLELVPRKRIEKDPGDLCPQIPNLIFSFSENLKNKIKHKNNPVVFSRPVGVK